MTEKEPTKRFWQSGKSVNSFSEMHKPTVLIRFMRLFNIIVIKRGRNCLRNVLLSVSEMFRPFNNPFRENRSCTHNGHAGKNGSTSNVHKRQTDGQAGRQADRQTCLTDRQRQTDSRQTETDRQTRRQTETERESLEKRKKRT